jgi:hypothetical protein
VTRLRIVVSAIKKPTCNDCCKLDFYGGGGDRTRVPRHFRADFYVRSRTHLHTVASQSPVRQGSCSTSRPHVLIPSVANVDPRRSGIAAGSRFSPAKNLSRGCLVRQPEPCYWQINFGRLFAWPADQPRRAACTSHCPVESKFAPESHTGSNIASGDRKGNASETGKRSEINPDLPFFPGIPTALSTILHKIRYT